LPLDTSSLVPEEEHNMPNTAFGAVMMLVQEAEDKLDKGEMVN